MYRRRRNENPIHNIVHAITTVADSMGDTFRPGGFVRTRAISSLSSPVHRYLQQQQALSPSRALPPPTPSSPTPTFESVSSYPTDQMFHFQSQSQPVKTRNDWGNLSQQTILKILELKRLVSRHPTSFSNPDMIIQCAIYFAMNGDNTVLDEKLAYLRSIR